nr:replication protein A 70 kDa DNA-binding subunit B [Tanacetum cinerariifolium]
MNAVNQESYFSKQAHSFVQKPNQKLTLLKNSNANKKVKTVWVKKVNTAKPKAAANAAKAKGKHKAVKEKGVMLLRPQHTGLIHAFGYSTIQAFTADSLLFDIDNQMEPTSESTLASHPDLDISCSQTLNSSTASRRTEKCSYATGSQSDSRMKGKMKEDEDNSGRLPLLAHKFKISLCKNSIVTRIAPIDDNIKVFVFEYFIGLWDSQKLVSEFDAVDVIRTVVDIGHIVPLNWAGVKKLRRTLMNAL